jgi:hypothetical protein
LWWWAVGGAGGRGLEVFFIFLFSRSRGRDVKVEDDDKRKTLSKENDNAAFFPPPQILFLFHTRFPKNAPGIAQGFTFELPLQLILRDAEAQRALEGRRERRNSGWEGAAAFADVDVGGRTEELVERIIVLEFFCVN